MERKVLESFESFGIGKLYSTDMAAIFLTIINFNQFIQFISFIILIYTLDFIALH